MLQKTSTGMDAAPPMAVSLSGPTVGGSMPVRIPETELLEQVVGNLFAARMPCSGATMMPSHWFTQEEVDLMLTLPMPQMPQLGLLGPTPVVLPAPHQPQETFVALTPSDGAMPIIVGAYSTSRVFCGPGKVATSQEIPDTREGVMCLLAFLNVRPEVSLTVTYAAEGFQDSIRKVDLTRFVFPFGKVVTSATSSLSVEAAIDLFLGDHARKKLQMSQRMCHSKLCTLKRLIGVVAVCSGWTHDLEVTLEVKSTKVCLDATSDSHSTSTTSKKEKCLRALHAMFSKLVRKQQESSPKVKLVSMFDFHLSPLQIMREIAPLVAPPCGHVRKGVAVSEESARVRRR